MLFRVVVCGRPLLPAVFLNKVELLATSSPMSFPRVCRLLVSLCHTYSLEHEQSP